MFDLNDFELIDPSYFNIIQFTLFTITIQSKNTKHYWHIERQKYRSFQSHIIYHRHHNSGPYHKHGHAKTLKTILAQIQAHDIYQLNKQNKKPIHTYK